MIHLLWCTIRTGNFPNVHKIWLDRTKRKDGVKCHVLVSTQNEATFLRQYFDAIKQDNRIEVYQPPYPGVCLPSYKLSSTFFKYFARCNNYSNNDRFTFRKDE